MHTHTLTNTLFHFELLNVGYRFVAIVSIMFRTIRTRCAESKISSTCCSREKTSNNDCSALSKIRSTCCSRSSINVKKKKMTSNAFFALSSGSPINVSRKKPMPFRPSWEWTLSNSKNSFFALPKMPDIYNPESNFKISAIPFILCVYMLNVFEIVALLFAPHIFVLVFVSLAALLICRLFCSASPLICFVSALDRICSRFVSPWAALVCCRNHSSRPGIFTYFSPPFCSSVFIYLLCLLYFSYW